MKKTYIAPCIEIFTAQFESHLCAASKSEYDLGKPGQENGESGGIKSDADGEIPNINSAKQGGFWED